MNKLRRMEIFRAVAEAGRFSLAADKLGLSKSAVSHAIKDLEQFLGVQLINRNNRDFQLTSDGEIYYRQCVHILSEIGAIEESYRQDQASIDGHIALTAPITFGVKRLSPLLSEFLSLNPKIDLSQTLAEHNVDLVQAGLDMAVRIGHQNQSTQPMVQITSVEMIITASPEFIASHPELKTPDDLKNVSTLQYRWTPKWNLSKDGKSFSHSPKGRILSDSGEALAEFTARGMGVSNLPDFIVDDAIESGRVERLFPDYEMERFPVNLVFPASNHRPVRVQKLADFLVQAFAESGKTISKVNA